MHLCEGPGTPTFPWEPRCDYPTLGEAVCIHDGNWNAGKEKTDKGEKAKYNQGRGGGHSPDALCPLPFAAFVYKPHQQEVTWVSLGCKNLLS